MVERQKINRKNKKPARRGWGESVEKMAKSAARAAQDLLQYKKFFRQQHGEIDFFLHSRAT
jgi:hypothetical protein